MAIKWDLTASELLKNALYLAITVIGLAYAYGIQREAVVSRAKSTDTRISAVEADVKENETVLKEHEMEDSLKWKDIYAKYYADHESLVITRQTIIQINESLEQLREDTQWLRAHQVSNPPK